jgi:hypothetical protein
MDRKHRKTLHAIFAHPEPRTLAPAAVEGVMRALGAEVREKSEAKLAFALRGHAGDVLPTEGALPKDEVRRLRRYLSELGVDPERDFPI